MLDDLRSRLDSALGRPRTSDFNRCDNRGSDLRRWRFFLREAAHSSDSLLAQALILLRHGLQGYSIGVCFVASNEKRKENKEVLGTSNNESKFT